MISYPPTKISKSLLNNGTIQTLIGEHITKEIITNFNTSILKSVKKIEPQNQKKILTARRGPKLTKKVVQQKVEILAELGFERTLCEQAIEAAFGSVERATEYLLSGNIPSVNFSTDEEVRIQKEKLVEENPVVRDDHPVIDINKDDIKSLNALGFDRDLVLQTYIACDKDIYTTQNCLCSMK